MLCGVRSHTVTKRARAVFSGHVLSWRSLPSWAAHGTQLCLLSPSRAHAREGVVMGPHHEAVSFLAAHFSPHLQEQESLSPAQGCVLLWSRDCYLESHLVGAPRILSWGGGRPNLGKSLKPQTSVLEGTRDPLNVIRMRYP